MTKQEYDNVTNGDKIKINAFYDKGRIVTLNGKSYKKTTSQDKEGFMIGYIFYPYKYTSLN